MHLSELIRQKPYEKPVYNLRRHPFIFIKATIVFAFVAVLPYFVYWLASATYPDVFAKPMMNVLTALGGSIYYLGVLLFYFSEFVDYYLDSWIVTNDRIVNIEQQGLFARTISELDLYKIQDVTSEIKGMIPTFLNYGTVSVQTAGEKERFIFEEISDPHEVRKGVINLAEEDRKFHMKDAKLEGTV